MLRDRQFGYRDAAHFYYPLYQRVQEEWRAGRWPLWEPEENGGMPLLGNPTAAVLYPGKVIYAALAYAWGARVYVVAHSLLAFAGMLVLLRFWGTSAAGAAIGALAFAFGMPVLFQYCNVIFLVGAAWLPLGIHAVDRWLRLGKRWALIELALVLAMQTLGGDPESAYVLGLCGGGYALGLVVMRQPATRGRWPGGRRLVLALLGLLVIWVGATLLMAVWIPRLRPPQLPQKPALAPTWMKWVPLVVLSVWGVAGVWFLNRWRRCGWRSPLATMLSGLIAAAVLGAALAAVQLLPVLEFTEQSGRAAGQGPHDIFPFSLEPIRLGEFLWPNFFGTFFEGNRSWFRAVPPVRRHAQIWVPSLYVGGLTLLLALGAIGFRGGRPWRAWMSAVVMVSLVASLGEYTSPLWWARWFPGCLKLIGGHDPPDTTTIRLDGFLRDGDGSIYWLMATLLPGFRQFRFPSKLLTFTTLGLAALAALGWDRLTAGPGRNRRVCWLAAGLLALSMLALGVSVTKHDRILHAFQAARDQWLRSPFGPLDPAGAYSDLRRALVQASAVLAIGLVLAFRGGRAGVVLTLVALGTTTADLAIANARYVLTVPQELFETTPKVVRLIEEAERREPAPGPYRVHRMPLWEPLTWTLEASPDRARDFLVWERETIQPKYGLPYGIHYTEALGVAELYDYQWFFGGFLRTIDAATARALNVAARTKVVVYPRRAFDFWNTRYFVLPVYPNGWTDERRGYAAFLANTDQIYPDPRDVAGPEALKRNKDWLEHEDFQILRNRNAYPRAWVVHQARFIKPIRGLERSDRDSPMEELLYANDEFWHDPGRVVFDPHVLAWIDADQRAAVLPYLPGMLPGQQEKVTVTKYTPQCVELDADLDHPGLVVLADIYYPGWRLSIDGVNAPIIRANRMMRGATVDAGRHHLFYTYEPFSFTLGAWITAAALAVLVALGIACHLYPVTSSLLPPETEVVE
jgi:hypothetical protein